MLKHVKGIARWILSGGRSSSGDQHRFTAAVAVAILMAAVGTALGLGPGAARGDETLTTSETPGATSAQTKAALESAGLQGLEAPVETDLQAARELPHRNLGREEALALAEGVFGAKLEAPAGVFDHLEPTRFLSDHAAVVPSLILAEASGGEAGESAPELPPEGDVVVESTLPLRTENEQGEDKPVDLGLQGAGESGATLKPSNPLVEVELPAHLGEGIGLPGPEVGIAVAGAPEEQTPSDVEGVYAFYPNVAENTDLLVAPTPSGVEMMTDIRSAEAPPATTYEVSMPAGAELKTGPKGAVEVTEGERTLALIPPPSATDAAGNPVTVTQRVEGHDLTVEVSPGPAAEFPILVDPTVVTEVWYWTYLHETEAAWSPSNDDPGIIQFWDCVATMLLAKYPVVRASPPSNSAGRLVMRPHES